MIGDRQYKYIDIKEEANTSGSTQVWSVVAKEGSLCIVMIKWFGRWRCYAFFPHADTVYEHNCLWDIADFIGAATFAKREEWKTRKKNFTGSLSG